MDSETSDPMPIGAALKAIRIRRGLTQSAVARLPGTPDFRSISHWETGRKLPSLRLLGRYLKAFDLDFRDLQDAIDEVQGIERAQTRLLVLEKRIAVVEQTLLAVAVRGGWTRDETSTEFRSQPKQFSARGSAKPKA